MKLRIIIGLAALLSACATTETPQAIGGNRAGGTVDLAFEFNMSEACG
jgi:starvation-inducible outer membrane lipoprotein